MDPEQTVENPGGIQPEVNVLHFRPAFNTPKEDLQDRFAECGQDQFACELHCYVALIEHGIYLYDLERTHAAVLRDDLKRKMRLSVCRSASYQRAGAGSENRIDHI